MAEFTRRTVLANPAPRRMARAKTKTKSTSPKRRKLSAAQIAAGFGGKRRRAAAKPTHRRTPKPVSRRASTRRVSTSPRKSRRTRGNPGDIITLALANPSPAATKGKKSMARRKKRSTTTRRRRTTTRRKRTNPVQVAYSRARRRRRRSAVSAAPRRRARRNPSTSRRRSRRNPSMGGMSAGGFSGLVTQGLWAIGGAVTSKLLTQAVLGSNNTGFVGYGGNFAAAFVAGTAVKALLKNQAAGNAVILGGVIQTLLRILIDKTPFGARVSNLGMGDYMAQNFLTPQRLVDGLNSAQIAPPVMPMMAPAKAGVGGYGGNLY